MPKAGPQQLIAIVILTAEFESLSLRNSVIASEALSVTVNIKLSPFPDGSFAINIWANLSIINVLSINFC
jgi:hypothetical protein